MEKTMELVPRPNAEIEGLRSTVTQPAIKTSDLAMMKYPQAEAALSLELDRIDTLSREHPLEALDQVVELLQGINFELLKNYVPVLTEQAHLMSAEFMTTGRVEEPKKSGHYRLVQFLQLQEAVAKLGIARVKVQDEITRRARCGAAEDRSA